MKPFFFVGLLAKHGAWCWLGIFMLLITAILPPAWAAARAAPTPTIAQLTPTRPSDATPTLVKPTITPTRMPNPSPTNGPIIRQERRPLVAIYALAYDNRITSTMNLTPHFTATLQGIISATLGTPGKLAIVLSDRDGINDTEVRVIHNGSVTLLAGLPNPAGILTPSLTEYDMADGATLGGFLRWARTSYSAQKTVFSYVGHGAPLVPQTDISTIFGPNTAKHAAQQATTLFPLPTNIGANPDLTDHHVPGSSAQPYSILTPHALAQALALGSFNGAYPFQVVDLLMCFAASVEEFYEIAPYAEMITGSPNYAFFSADLPGAALAAVTLGQPSASMAAQMIQTYDGALPPTPPTGHPRILVAVKSAQLAAVKTAWDKTAEYLYQGLIDPDPLVQASTRIRMVKAYEASWKYDTTFCQPYDWELVTPDALVDLAHFAGVLGDVFGSSSPTGAAALATQQAVWTAATPAVIDQTAHNGQPWFDLIAPSSTWIFVGPNPLTPRDDAAGLSMYADLVGRPHGTQIELSWHAHWYTDVLAADNLYPYRFLADLTTSVGWDEVFSTFWQGAELTTAACIPRLPPAQVKGELSVMQILTPSQNGVVLGQPVLPAVLLRLSPQVINPLVRFRVSQAGQTVFEDMVGAGVSSATSTLQRVQTSRPWVPQQAGPFVLEVWADADQRVIETNEQDNLGMLSSNVRLQKQ